MALLITGRDYVSGDIESYQQNNRLKNHWRDNNADLTNPSPGMIMSDPTDEKLYHYQAAAWQEIIQTATPISDDAQIIGGDGSDAILIPYEETTNDAVIWGLPVDPKRGLIFCDVADIGASFVALVPVGQPCISIIDSDVDSVLHFGFQADDIPHMDSNRIIRFQYNAAAGISAFENSAAAENRPFYIYGYITEKAGGAGPLAGAFQMEDVNNEFIVSIPNDTGAEGFSVVLNETNQRFRIRQNSDVITEWHDGTDANIAWTGTDLNLLPPAGGAVTIDGGANNLAAGLNIINLGTATIGIDLSNSGLAGAADYLIYFNASNLLRASGEFLASNANISSTIKTQNIEQNQSRGLVRFKVDDIEKFGVTIGENTPVGTFSVCTVGAASAIIQHADIDTNTAVGDLVHVTSGTGITEGFYRIITIGVNQVTVDRDVSGAGGADIVCAVYKDVIGFFATDGVNGQRIMNYSHQDKPLQIGGDTLQATAGLGSEDVVLGGITGYTRQGALYNWPYQGDVADDGTFNLPAFTHSCWGFIQAEHNEEYAIFTVDNDGDVILISNSANVVANADTDTKLCIGTAATQEPLVIRNRLGVVKNINLFIWYD